MARLPSAPDTPAESAPPLADAAPVARLPAVGERPPPVDDAPVARLPALGEREGFKMGLSGFVCFSCCGCRFS